MALNINNIGINPFTAARPVDIVPGDELSKVAREILTGSTSVNTTVSAKVGNLDATIFAPGSDVNNVMKAATNRAGLNLELSQNTLSTINALKAHAAILHVSNISKAVDGKIHVNAERVDISENKSVWALSNKPEVFESSNLYNDRRGPGGFYFPNEEDDDEQEEKGINLVI